MQRNRSVFFRTLLFVFASGLAIPSIAQNLNRHNWYFGNSTQAIRFNRVDNSPSLINSKAIPFGTGGSAVATDPVTGNVLFYTDGSSVYDITNKPMPGGTGLGATTNLNQPVAIAKVPGKMTQYYVFMNSAGTISYRIIDMSLFGNAVFPAPALGDAIGGNIPLGLTGRSEAMITIQDANREDFYLITHANGTPDYSVTKFTAAGPQVTMNITGLGLIEVAASFSYHPGSKRIATSPQEKTRDIEIVTFDDTNGVLSFTQRVLNTGVASTTSQAIYDTEWSSSGQYLYVSRFGEPGIAADVMQYDLLDNFATLTSILPAPIFRSYGLQMAPDSAIYHLYQRVSGGPFLLGAILRSDSTATDVRYNPNAFASASDFLGMQFPNFAPKDSIFLTVNFTSRGTCSNAPTSFFPTVDPGADSLVWDFGDGGGATGWSPVYTYQTGGSYSVKVKAYLNGDTASFTAPVTITQFDLQLTLVQDTTACVCELPINNGKPTANPSISCPNDTSDDMQVKAQSQGGTPTFQWFGPGGILPSQTTATLRPDSAGYYYVVASIGACQAYAGVNIKEYDSLDQRANIWYFGDHAGIDFNPLPENPIVAITGPLDTPEGCSVICDRNGQVIFSTDGQRIYDKDDVEITPIPNPPGLGGEPGSTQSSLIIPVPGDETLFYIFTTQEVYGTNTYECRYSLFDLKLNNGQGGLLEFNKLLFTKSTERLTGNARWLIAHEYGNNSFRAYSIGPEGISNPVISSIGSDHTFSSAQEGQGYMELGAGSRLAVALSKPGISNVVELFDFVDSTGMVTNFRTANLNSTTGQVYGIEISPGGNKLFATLRNTPSSDIYEFSIDSLGNTHFKQKVTKPGELGAMQIGPDGQIYVAINGSTSLGTFTANEDTTMLSSSLVPFQAFNLAAGTQSQLGLPNFTQIIANPTQTPGFSFTGLCLGDSTHFAAMGKDPAIDKFDWDFGDGNAQADGGPEIAHLYSLPGSYVVNVKIYNKCETVGTYTGTVVIRNKPADPSTAVVMCTGDAILDANPSNAANLSFVWSTGDSTKTITVTRQAIYTVTITDDLGCSTDGTFLASDNRPQVDFGPDQSICQNTALMPLNAQNPGTTYSWTVDGVNNGNTTQTQAVDTTIPGVFEYAVLITDPVTTCFKRDTIQYTINESPAFTATPTNPTSCAVNNGKIDLTITAPAASLFTYSITGPGITQSNTDQVVGVVISTPSTLDGGTYGITVSDQVTGCATINTTTLNDPAFTVAATVNGTCDPITLNVTITPTPGPLVAPFLYRVINSGTGLDAQSSTSVNTLSFTTTQALASNNQQYTVEVTNNGCIASSPAVTVNEAATVSPSFAINACVSPITISASAGTSWSWSGPGILGSSTTQQITATPPQGSQNYNVLIKQTGLCDLDTTLTVFVDNGTVANFTQSDPCEDQVLLSATPSGSFTYRWYRNNTLVPGGQTLQIGLSDNGASYRVEVVSTNSGCVFPSAAKPVNVAGDIRVTLLATNPCEGSPFTITAVPNPSTITNFTWTRDNAPLPTTTAVLTDTKAGKYVATVNQSGCIVSDYMNVIPAPVTPGSLRDDGIICPDPANPDPTTREIVLNAGNNFITYQWFKENVALGVTTQTYTATEAGNYSVDLLNTYGCASSDKTTLVEECDPRVTGPNAFRPTSNVMEGGEMTNRDFRVFTFFIADTDFQIFIFNRWGEMVYQSSDKNFRWNGGYNNNAGQPLPPGTYSYVVKFKSSYRPQDGVREQRGGVVLLR